MYPKYDFIRSLNAGVKAVSRRFAYDVDVEINITEAELLAELQSRGSGDAESRA